MSASPSFASASPGLQYALSGQLQITRNGNEISQEDYAHIQSVSITKSRITYNNIGTIEFSIASPLTAYDPVSGQYAEDFQIMYDYIFSKGTDIYEIFMARYGQPLKHQLTGSITGLQPRFNADGQISFSITLTNDFVTDPTTVSDELRSNTWPEGTTLYTVVTDTIQDAKRVIHIDPQTQSYLQSVGYTNGKTRPAHQSTIGFLNELADAYDFSIYVKGKDVYLRHVDIAGNPKLYFVYRPSADIINDETGYGVIIDFNPDLQLLGFAHTNAPGTQTNTGDNVDGTNQSDNNNADPNNSLNSNNFTLSTGTAPTNTPTNNPLAPSSTPPATSVGSTLFGTSQ